MTGERTDTDTPDAGAGTTGADTGGKALATLDRNATGECPNCGAELLGQWCFRCGQSQKPIDRFFLSLVAEAFDDVFAWDSRAARTLFALLFRPGFLTAEYFAGRRARYIPPLRLYIVASVLFFSVLSLQTLMGTSVQGDNLIINIGEESTDEAPQPATDGAAQNDQRADTAAPTSDRDQGNWREALDSDIDDLHLDWLSATDNEALRARLKTQARKFEQEVADDPRAAADLILDVAPPLVFIFLPLFALLLKAVYLGSDRYYTEHLVLAVHNHSFLFVILTLETIFDGMETQLPFLAALGTAIHVWIQVYLYLSLRRVYNEGYILTFFKFLLLGSLYFVFLMIGLVVAFILGVMTL